MQTANAALAANGYRAEHASQHYRMIQSLEYTLGLDQATISQFDAYRKKRNVSSYDRLGMVSALEADEMLRLAKEIRAKFEEWLRTNKPGLLD